MKIWEFIKANNHASYMRPNMEIQYNKSETEVVTKLGSILASRGAFYLFLFIGIITTIGLEHSEWYDVI